MSNSILTPDRYMSVKVTPEQLLTVVPAFKAKYQKKPASLFEFALEGWDKHLVLAEEQPDKFAINLATFGRLYDSGKVECCFATAVVCHMFNTTFLDNIQMQLEMGNTDHLVSLSLLDFSTGKTEEQDNLIFLVGTLLDALDYIRYMDFTHLLSWCEVPYVHRKDYVRNNIAKRSTYEIAASFKENRAIYDAYLSILKEAEKENASV
jgi:hypothetical protein